MTEKEDAASRLDQYEDWQELAPRWERSRRLLWDSTRAVSEWLVERLDPQPGQTILDVAAGTGETGFLAAQRLGPHGKLISSDLSPNMVEAAARVATEFGVGNAEFRTLDAERLELADASVDGVLCRWGYILRGDPPAAMREIRRVLRSGGRLGFSVWAERARNAWMTVPSALLADRGYLRPETPAQIALSLKRNPETIERLLAATGFDRVEIEELQVSYRFANADELWFFISELRGPVARSLAATPDEERADLRAAIEERVGRRVDGSFELGGVSLNVITS